MTRAPSRAAKLVPLALVVTLAAVAGADEARVYRWVGEDGHVYTSTTPPPEGKGMIDPKPAPKPAAAKATPAAAAKPAPAPASTLSLRQLLLGAEPAAPAARPSVAPQTQTDECSRYRSLVLEWRQASSSVDSARAYVDSLQSDTDGYVRRNDSYYERQVDAAEQRLDAAEDRLSQVEGQTQRAGVPQGCLTE